MDVIQRNVCGRPRRWCAAQLGDVCDPAEMYKANARNWQTIYAVGLVLWASPMFCAVWRVIDKTHCTARIKEMTATPRMYIAREREAIGRGTC